MSPPTVLRRLALSLTLVGSLLPGLGAQVPSALDVAPFSPPAAVVVPPVPAAPGRSTLADAGVHPAPELLVDVDSLRGTWSWPLAPRPDVLRPFVAPASTYGAGHRGLDLAARQGQAVTAVDAGTVTHVGVIAGRGTVSVTHASGLRSTYEPVSASVARGARVTQGQVIAVVTGRSHCGGACLHLGALVGQAYVDPRPLLGGGPVILLPLSGGPGPSG